MFIPMLMPAIYTSALIFGPAFVIVLALCVALAVRFSSLKGWIGVAMVVIGIIELSLVPVWVLWVFLIGLCTLIIGITMFAISVGVSGLPYWIGKHSSGNIIRYLKKGIYVLLAVVIFSSAVVLSLRTTNALREELYDDWSWKTIADTTVRGVVTEIYLNYEVNVHGYSYHIFPALVIVNVTEVVEVGESWVNLTEESEHWMNENMTVAYDKSDVPSLIVGQRVEARGYFDVPIEDTWSYSHKLVIATEIEDSYIKNLGD
jgi:hypothetical protein